MKRVDVRVQSPMPETERLEGLGKACRHPARRGLGVLTELNEALSDIERVHDTFLLDTQGARRSRLSGQFEASRVRNKWVQTASQGMGRRGPTAWRDGRYRAVNLTPRSMRCAGDRR